MVVVVDLAVIKVMVLDVIMVMVVYHVKSVRSVSITICCYHAFHSRKHDLQSISVSQLSHTQKGYKCYFTSLHRNFVYTDITLDVKTPNLFPFTLFILNVK